MKKYIFLLTIFCVNVHAGWSGTGNVEDVYSHNGVIIFNSTITGNGCGKEGKFWWPTTDDDSEEMYTMILAALMSNATIRVNYDDASPASACFSRADLITHMKIDKP